MAALQAPRLNSIAAREQAEDGLYALAIEGEGVAIRKTVSEETVRRIMNIVFLAEHGEARRAHDPMSEALKPPALPSPPGNPPATASVALPGLIREAGSSASTEIQRQRARASGLRYETIG
jgi:hypothetical protein